MFLSVGFKTIQLVNTSCFQKVCRNFSKRSGFHRPSLENIKLIATGQAGKRRNGMAPPLVPCRLKDEEHLQLEIAMKRNFLTLSGPGRNKDKPLIYVYRNYCDCKSIPYISVIKSATNEADDVIVDFSPLRTINVKALADWCMTEARNLSSFVSAVDDTSLSTKNLDKEKVEELMLNDPVCNLPVLSIIARFSERVDSKQYAKLMVNYWITNTDEPVKV